MMPGEDTLLTGRTKELVRITELDYDRTTKFIEGVVGTSATIRGILLTAWVAVITLAFDTGNWTIAAASFAIVVVLGTLDAYHSWLYNQGLGHAVKLEDLGRAYHRALSRGGDDPHADVDFEVKLQDDPYGLYHSLGKFKWKDLREIRPRIFFQILYPALLTISIIAAALLAATSAANSCYSVQVQAAPAAAAGSASGSGATPATLISPGEQVKVCKDS
jgi:hypothetical protein